MKIISALCFCVIIAVCAAFTVNEEVDHLVLVEPAASSAKLIALTFDDGPTDTTLEILDILAEFDARATFFVVADRLERFPQTVKRIANEGHQLGNHSYSHKQLNAISAVQIAEELDKANVAIYQAAGVIPTILRPPYGEFNDNVLKEAYSRGMAVIHWSIDTLDWLEGTPAERIAGHVLNNVKEGDIILMHDLYPQSAKAAEIILKELTAQGFAFVTVDELIAHYSHMPEPGAVYKSGIKKYDVTHEVIGDIFE